MFHTSKIARFISVFAAIAITIGLLPIRTVSGQSTVQAPYIGMWMNAQELANLPTSGAAWTALVSAANKSAGSPDIQNQDSDNDVYVLAKALVYARTGNTSYRNQVISQLQAAINTENGGRTLALGRNLVSYVIAADLVNLPAANPSFDQTFRTWLLGLLTETLDGRTLISTHEDRPNNWGTHAGASRAAVAWYLGDRTQLDRTALVFRGWLGDRAAYSDFSYGVLDWQCNPSAPVGVNPKGCTKNGVNIDGAQPEEMRRGGGFTNPPTFTGYPWEALQGAFVQAIILHRAGYPTLEFADRALLRAVEYLYRIGWKAEGDDMWQPWLINYYYGTNYATGTAGKGKNMGWTDWTHASSSNQPSTAPTLAPTIQPTPTLAPPSQPTTAPTTAPTAQPTTAPTSAPTTAPTAQPTSAPVSGSPLKSITFENGTIKDGNTGVDRTTGSPTLVNSGALSGSYSLGFVNTNSAYVQEDFSGADEIFVSFLLKVSSLPGSDTRILFFSNGGDTTANIVLNKNGTLRMRIGSTTIGSNSSALATNTVYRVGLYQKRGSGGNAVAMAYLAPAGQSFGSPFAASTNGSWTGQATFLRFGATANASVNVVFDDLILYKQFVP